MAKGMSGSVVSIVVSLVIAIIVLVLLWVLFNDLVKVLSDSIADVMLKLKCSFCEKIGFFSKIGRLCASCN